MKSTAGALPGARTPPARTGRTVLVFRHVPHEGLGTLGPALKTAGLAVRTIDVARNRPAFPSLKTIAGLVVMGGPMGVYEKRRYPFLRRESAYIKKAIAARKPVLGICLGSQLIADALGSRVYPHSRKEIGWHPLRLARGGRSDPFFRRLKSRETVFQWHGDTFDLPRDAVLLASSPLCRHQAFRFRDNVYGLQFHIEVDDAMVRDWLSQPGADRELAAAGPAVHRNITARLSARTARLHRLARPLFRGFTRLFNPRGLSGAGMNR